MIFVEATMPQVRKRLVTLADDAQLIEAAKLLREAGTDIVVVCDRDGMLAGVITKTDVVAQISHCQGGSCRTAASSVMNRDVVTCQPGDHMDIVWAEMKARSIKNLPVIDVDSRPVGVFNARDALQALMQEVENEESLLRDYVQCVGYH